MFWFPSTKSFNQARYRSSVILWKTEDGYRQNFQSKKRASLYSLGEEVVSRDPVRPLIEGKEAVRQFLSLAAFIKRV